jgi:hypothetical protein
MPANYKYEFITKGQKKALERACIEAGEMRRHLKSSGDISSSILERAEILYALVAKAAGWCLSNDQRQALEPILGKDLGEENKKQQRPTITDGGDSLPTSC